MQHLPSLVVRALALLSFPFAVSGATLPAPPLTLIDTTYSAPSGNTITVNAGGNLQAALNSAALGDTIVLQAGATFTGPFTLPNKTTGSGWIYIRSSAYSSLPPPGTRVTPADAVNMPKITVTNNVGGAIQTAAGAHHYRFVGIEFLPISGRFVTNLLELGTTETTLASLPNNITVDRCYIHGDPAVGGRRGVLMNGSSIAVIDSYLSDFKEIGVDSQALLTFNSPGPLKIFNNYLEAAGENFMAGGGDPKISNMVPSDIEVRRNYFFKPLAWINQSWSVKNLFELKNAQRVLVEGNTFENSWPAAQIGFGILVTPRNQEGTAPWSVTQDVTFRLNKVINVANGLNVSGRDDLQVSQVTRRLLFENNLFLVTRLAGQSGAGAGRVFQVLFGPVDVTIRHNTALITAVSGGTASFWDNNPKGDQLDIRDNLVSNGDFGFFGNASSAGTVGLNAHFTNYSFLKNAVIGGIGSIYPAGNFFPASVADIGFVDYAGGNYRLGPTSAYLGAGSDGKDLGANIGAIEAAISGSAMPTLPVTVSVARLGSGTGSVTSLPSGVSCGTLCTVNFDSGAFIALTANAASGSVFTGWSGACTGTGTCYITLSQPSSVTATFDVPSNTTPRLSNISTRLPVLTGSNVMIGGFIAGGTGAGSKNVIVRARGPSLSSQGVTGVLANPLLQVFSGSTSLASNDDWQVGPGAAAVQSSGLAPGNPQEAAVPMTLTPGAYTALVSGVSGTTGVGIVEVFELDNPAIPLTNISTRGLVQTGNNVMIAGFVIAGNSPLTVVVRARGPSLAQSGLTGVLGNPVLQLFSGSTSVAINDDWQLAANSSAIQLSGFAPSNPLESAILITLNPGAYTAVVSGAGGTSTGLAIVEVFAL